MPDEKFPQRRTPAKGVHISLGGPNWVFLTVNIRDRVFDPLTDAQQRVPTKERVPTTKVGTTNSKSVGTTCGSSVAWLAQPSIQRALHGIWLNTATAWLVSDYLLMPDHLHLFCAPHDLRFTIERWISFWKDCLAKAQPEAGTFQRGGFHHRLCDAENYSEKWQYVRENPMRAGLVAMPDEWPYQGRVHEIQW